MRPGFEYHFGLLAVLIFAFQGCADFTLKPSTERTVDKRIASAMHAEKRGNFAAALREWEIVQLIDPGNEVADRKIENISMMIDSMTADLVKSARHNYDKRMYTQARHDLLTALSLDPALQQHTDILRKIEERKRRKIQAARITNLQQSVSQTTKQTAPHQPDEERYYLRMSGLSNDKNSSNMATFDTEEGIPDRASDENYDNANQTDPLVDKHLQLAFFYRDNNDLVQALDHFKIAEKYAGPEMVQLPGYIKTTKEQLAEQYYSDGVRIFPANIDKAIEYWEKAISYNAEHSLAQQRLNNAYKARKTLMEIDDAAVP